MTLMNDIFFSEERRMTEVDRLNYPKGVASSVSGTSMSTDSGKGRLV